MSTAICTNIYFNTAAEKLNSNRPWFFNASRRDHSYTIAKIVTQKVVKIRNTATSIERGEDVRTATRTGTESQQFV